MNSRWLSVQEIAVHLGASRDTVYRWIGDRRQAFGTGVMHEIAPVLDHL